MQKRFRWSLILLLCLCMDLPIQAQLIIPTCHKVSIRGTSNLYDWEEQVQRVSAAARLHRQDDASIMIESMSMVMDVYSIKSSKGMLMDKYTYKALKAAKHPFIKFEVTTPVTAVKAKAENYTFKAKANITVAGVTKSVDMIVQMVAVGEKIILKGRQKIRMTDFDITPPTVLMGMLKTGNEITVDYNFEFAEPAISANFN